MRSKLVSALVLGLVVLVGILFVQWQNARTEAQELAAMLVQAQSQGAANEAVVADVLARVRQHIDLPEDVQATVATIVDVEKLRLENPFYNNANNGDYLIVTNTRAILYAGDRDVIVDVVPVQVGTGATMADGDASSDTQ